MLDGRLAHLPGNGNHPRVMSSVRTRVVIIRNQPKSAGLQREAFPRKPTFRLLVRKAATVECIAFMLSKLQIYRIQTSRRPQCG
jgi:hypothetical protein